MTQPAEREYQNTGAYSSNPQVVAGWYPDPNLAGYQRYWDGAAWTEYYYNTADGSTNYQQNSAQGAVSSVTQSGPVSLVSHTAPAAVGSGTHHSSSTVVVNNFAPKSEGLALLLAILFGPLGMLYSTVSGAIIMFFVDLVVIPLTALLTIGLGLVVVIPVLWLICGIWAYSAAKSYNAGGAGNVVVAHTSH